MNHDAKWLQWAKELQAIAQIGLAYTEGGVFDRERYVRLRELAAEMIAANSGIDKGSMVAMFDREQGYATPKVAVRGVVFRDDEILLVQERDDGLWTLPGGWADVNQGPREVVAREIREESGYEALPRKLLAVFDRSKHEHHPAFPFHVYKLFILCELTGGQARPSNETFDAQFFAETALPKLSVSRVTASQIRRMFEHRRNPGLPTDFD